MYKTKIKFKAAKYLQIKMLWRALKLWALLLSHFLVVKIANFCGNQTECAQINSARSIQRISIENFPIWRN